MADKNPEAATAAPGEKRAAARPVLAKASESADAAVQELLAVIQAARLSGDRAAERAAVERLNELGYQ